MRVELVPGATLRREPDAHRRVYSSCSLCGAEAIEEIARELAPFAPQEVAGADVCELGRRLRADQPIFELTGGTHAAALAEMPLADDGALFVREDLGRHNALDKVVGAAAMRVPQIAARRAVLFLSGRLSFEMVAKAARAGIPASPGSAPPRR